MKKGDTVKLSPEGLRIFNRARKGGIRPEDRRGKIMSTRMLLSDRCVRVWWDHYTQPETIATCFIEVVTV